MSHITVTETENLSDPNGGTLKASGATYTLTGLNTGSVSVPSGTFTEMKNLPDGKKDG